MIEFKLCEIWSANLDSAIYLAYVAIKVDKFGNHRQKLIGNVSPNPGPYHIFKYPSSCCSEGLAEIEVEKS